MLTQPTTRTSDSTTPVALCSPVLLQGQGPCAAGGVAGFQGQLVDDADEGFAVGAEFGELVFVCRAAFQVFGLPRCRERVQDGSITDNWCSAVSNSKRPRRRTWDSRRGCCDASPGGASARMLEGGGGQSGVPAPMTTASVVGLTARRPLGRSSRTGRPWPRTARGRPTAGAPSP